MPTAPISPKTKEIIKSGKGRELSIKTRDISTNDDKKPNKSNTIEHDGKKYIIEQV